MMDWQACQVLVSMSLQQLQLYAFSDLSPFLFSQHQQVDSV